jgi:putative transposase
MTATLDGVPKKIKPEPSPEQWAAEELMRQAREQGLSLTGQDGLLKQLTKTVLETALTQELTEHLGHEKNGQPDPDTGDVRNGTRPKAVLTSQPGTCRSTSRGTGPGRSPLRSSASGSGGSSAWMRSCCRCMRRA